MKIDSSFQARGEGRFQSLDLPPVLDLPPNFIELLPVAAYACDASGHVLWFNTRAADMWGREPRIGDDTELFCGSYRLFFGGREINRAETPMAVALRTGEAIQGVEGMVERPDGSQIWATVHIEPVKDAAGRVLGAINCFHDTTELHHARAETAEREEHTRRILEAMPAAVYTTDDIGRITYFNDAAAKLAGRRPTLWSDEWCVTWKLYWPDGTPLPHDQCPMALALKEKRPNNGLEAIAERPDGTRVPFIPYPTPLFDASGVLTGAVNMLVDITDRKRTERLQKEQNDLLEGIASGIAFDECLVRLAEAVSRLQPSARGCVLLTDEARESFERISSAADLQSLGDGILGTPTNELAIGTCGTAVYRGEPITCRDIANDERWSQSWRDLCLGHGIRACHSTPIFQAGGKAVGSFLICFAEVHEPDSWELNIAGFGAHIAAVAIERERTARALVRSEQNLTAELDATRQLQALSTELIHEQDVQALYQKLVDAAAAIMKSEYASMQMLYPERGSGGELQLLAFRGFNPQAAKFWEWVRADSESTCGVALRTRKRVIAEDISRCEFMAGTEDLETYLQTGIHAVQSTPLFSRGGRLLGMISTHWSKPHTPADSELRLLDLLARQAADLIERAESEERLRDSEEQLRLATEAADVGLWDIDPINDRLFLSTRVRAMFGIAADDQVSITDFHAALHVDDRERTSAAFADTLDPGKRSLFDVEYRTIGKEDGETRWIAAKGRGVFNADGICVRVIGTAIDITQRKRHEDRQKLLLNELNHRVKNTLVTVQSMAMQTLRSSPDTAHAQKQIEARLIALSKAHDILTEEQWEGASLRQVIEKAVAPYCGQSRERFEIEGPSVRVSSKYALALAMGLHELCTNAVKYGALSNDAGQVRIAWTVAGINGSRELSIRWSELGGPAVEPPSRRGFGSRLIQRGLKQDLGGEVRIDFAPAGVICTIETPLEHASRRME